MSSERATATMAPEGDQLQRGQKLAAELHDLAGDKPLNAAESQAIADLEGSLAAGEVGYKPGEPLSDVEANTLSALEASLASGETAPEPALPTAPITAEAVHTAVDLAPAPAAAPPEVAAPPDVAPTLPLRPPETVPVAPAPTEPTAPTTPETTPAAPVTPEAATPPPAEPATPSTETTPPTTETTPAPPEPPTAEGAPAPNTSPLEIHLVGEHKVAAEKAHEVAERRLNESLAAHRGFKEAIKDNGFWKGMAEGAKGVGTRMWKGGLARNYYLIKERTKADREIKESGNALIHEGATLDDYRREAAADVDRFVHHYHGTLDASEAPTQLTSENGAPVVSALMGVVREAVEQNMDAATFRTSSDRVIQGLAKNHPNLIKEANLYADNLGQIFEQVKIRTAAGMNLDEIMANTKVYMGEASTGTNVETKYNGVERVMTKVMDSKIGSRLLLKGAINEDTLATAVGVAYSFVVGGSRSVASAASKVGLIGVGAGVMTAIRENRRMKEERAQHMRERAEGRMNEQDIPENSRRARFEAGSYNMASARWMMDNIRDTTFETKPDGTRAAKEFTRETFYNAVMHLTNLETRREISDKKKVALIRYQSPESRRTERKETYLLAAEAKAALRKAAQEHPELFQGNALGNAGSFDEALTNAKAVHERLIEGDMTAKDKLARNHRLKAVIGKTALAMSIGVAAGTVLQEGMAAFRPDEVGLLPHVGTPEAGAHQTLLRGWFDNINGGGDHAANMLSDNIHTQAIDGHTVQVPDGVSFKAEPDGSYDLMRGDQVASSGLHFGPDGGLDQASVQHLQAAGVAVDHQPGAPKIDHQPTTVNSAEYAQQSLNTTEVHRTEWMSNNTPNKPDLNELKLWWGGQHGVDANGNYNMSMSHMTPNGSFNHGLSVNAQELARNGQLKMLISLNDASQDHVFAIPVQPDGSIQIPADSEVGKLAFTTDGNGNAVFNGRYAEVAQSLGKDSNGVEQVRILATHTGHGFDTVATTTTVETPTTVTVIHGVPVPAAPEAPVDAPPIAPIYARRGLESVEEAPVPTPEAPYYYMGGATPEQQAQWRRERSPRLLDNPSAELNMNEEISWYVSELERKYGQDYINKLRSNVAANESLKNLPKDLKSIVCIPVGAAIEQDNIYNTLSLYAQQDPEALKESVVLMHVNWVNDADMAKVAKTKAEIERARKDFPDLKIAAFETEWSRDWVTERQGRLYGQIMKNLYDTAFMALHDGSAAGELQSKDVQIVGNDADPHAIGKHYLKNLHKALDAHPEADILLGTVRWGTKDFKDQPGYGTVVTAMQVLQQLTRRPGAQYGVPAALGPNTSFRASTLAAVGSVNGDMGAGTDIEIGLRIWDGRSTPGGSAGTVGSMSGGTTPAGGSPQREVWRMVAGAGVDTSGDRLLGTYMAGEPITHAWLGYNEAGGYAPRDAKPVTGVERDEAPDVILSRVEFQLSAILNDWSANDKQRTDALNIMFPPGGERGPGSESREPLWSMIRNEEGHVDFQFTDLGRRVATERFQRYGDFVDRHITRTHVRPVEGPLPSATPPAGGPTPPTTPPASRRRGTTPPAPTPGPSTPPAPRPTPAPTPAPAPTAPDAGQPGPPEDPTLLAARRELMPRLPEARTRDAIVDMAQEGARRGLLRDSGAVNQPIERRYSATEDASSASYRRALLEQEEAVWSYGNLRSYLHSLKPEDLPRRSRTAIEMMQADMNAAEARDIVWTPPMVRALVETLPDDEAARNRIINALARQLISAGHIVPLDVPDGRRREFRFAGDDVLLRAQQGDRAGELGLDLIRRERTRAARQRKANR
ncbi:MAG TPA: hypothetical protein VLI05_05855 [Candidatus Saccharimonadia bacterium]|nr:hypothetical protein [Candidatus Saccharimonadia bacterium]